MARYPLIFLADDDVDDQMLFLEALAEINAAIRCIIATNGEEALNYFKQKTDQLPDFIFLDLNMPRMSGLKCLAELKKMDIIKNIPVIMYSTSAQQDYIEKSLQLGAQHFFVKPTNFSGLTQFLRQLLH